MVYHSRHIQPVIVTDQLRSSAAPRGSKSTTRTNIADRVFRWSAPGDSVLHGNPATLPTKGWNPLPNFGPSLLWPNGWMDQDGSWHGGPHCARWRHSSPTQKGSRAPNFRPIFIVAKRLHGSRCHLVRR